MQKAICLVFGRQEHFYLSKSNKTVAILSTLYFSDESRCRHFRPMFIIPTPCPVERNDGSKLSSIIWSTLLQLRFILFLKMCWKLVSNCPVSKKTDLDEFDQLVYQQIKARSKMGLHTEPRLNIDLVLRESSTSLQGSPQVSTSSAPPEKRAKTMLLCSPSKGRKVRQV